ncbi:acyl-CoA carboxylase epsilon subunit [Streptomyces cyaneofuscatus]|uniref:acyl-CoA carboxylase epsilon subunit n=1 Tax=Streptomyces cyaneofuscatus TaxID=66883 RepID=UPI003651CC45
MTDPAQPLIQVVRGVPDATDLAALTAVLLARVRPAGAGHGDPRGRTRSVARWSRPDRRAPFAGPRTWQEHQ